MGKWLPQNKQLFEQYNIAVDFEELGWLDVESILHPSKPKEEKMTFRERLYRVKWLYKQVKKKLRKKHRRFLSTH